MTHQVYVIQNPSGKYYIGYTEDVSARLTQHNSELSQWTKGKGPWVLVWTSEILSKTDARLLELKLKRQGRGQGFYAITGLKRSSCS